MPKKASKRTLKSKLDTLFSKVVRSVGRCERCNRNDGTLQCCHINSRRFMHTRWNQLNAVCMCASCHFWSHQHPRDFGKWVDEYYGEGTMDEIYQLSRCTKPLTLDDMQKIYDDLLIQV
jgi:hypothetical protein